MLFPRAGFRNITQAATCSPTRTQHKQQQFIIRPDQYYRAKQNEERVEKEHDDDFDVVVEAPDEVHISVIPDFFLQ